MIIIKFHEFMLISIITLSMMIGLNMNYMYEDKVDAYCDTQGYMGGDAKDGCCYNYEYVKDYGTLFNRHNFTESEWEIIKNG